VRVCVCVCVCVREREIERERACVCVCVQINGYRMLTGERRNQCIAVAENMRSTCGVEGFGVSVSSFGLRV